ncbi:hypothetical protein AMJ49_02310 [Parcubacteria bacterium DG_74_2]|nr:MAG: hypothetical protein AMJ49_02310 [Parcubacteria bacterium DG_74_2]
MFDLFQKPFGLDISDYSIEIVSLSGSIENPKLSCLGRLELPPGILENGQILNKKDLEKFLKNLISNPEFGKIKIKKFIFSLPESKSFIYISEIPENFKKEDTPEFIKLKASENFPFPLTEIYFDFQIREKEIFLVAVPKRIVDDYLEVFKNCSLQPLALEIESESLARSLIEGEKETVLIADIGTRMTNFSLFDKKKLRLSISYPIAGNKFTKTVSEKLKISFAEAENLKREVGLNPEKKEGKIFLILQEEIQGLIKEIKGMEEYFQKKTSRKIGKIILAGGSASLPYLREYLAENLEKEVLIGDPWVKINIDILRKKEYFKEALKINPLLYSITIGLALRGLTKNPKEEGIDLIKKIKM